jgi:ABC-2 type transport system permease protein
VLLLVRKDLLQAWRTFRLPALILTGVFFALLEPLTAKFMPQILGLFGDQYEGLADIIPEMGPAEALLSFCGDLTQIVALVLIIVAMGAVALERERGISAWVLTRPVDRGAYLWSKYLALLIGMIITVAVSGALAITYTASLFGSVPLSGALWALLFIAIFLMLILAVTVCASAFFRSQLAAGGIGLAFLFAIFLPQLIFGQTDIGRYFPHVLSTGHVGHLLSGLEDWSYFFPAAVITVILAQLFIAVAAHYFKQTEL